MALLLAAVVAAFVGPGGVFAVDVAVAAATFFVDSDVVVSFSGGDVAKNAAIPRAPIPARTTIGINKPWP